MSTFAHVKTQVITFAEQMRPYLKRAWQIASVTAEKVADWGKETYRRAKPHVIAGRENLRQWFTGLSPRGKNAVMIVSTVLLVSLLGVTVAQMSGNGVPNNKAPQESAVVAGIKQDNQLEENNKDVAIANEDDREMLLFADSEKIKNNLEAKKDDHDPRKKAEGVPFIDIPERTYEELSLSANGKMILLVSDGYVWIFDVESGKVLHKLPDDKDDGFGGGIRDAAFSVDGKKVIMRTGSDYKVWDMALERPVNTERNNTYRFSLSPNGKFIATEDSSSILIRNAETGLVLRKWKHHMNGFDQFVFSPDATKIAIASQEKITAAIWEVETGQELIRMNEGYIAFSPDSKKMVTASNSSNADSSARIWDVYTNKELFRLEGHTGQILSASFSPNGKYIVTASYDNTARIWDVETGKALHKLEGHLDDVQSAVFSQDGNRVITASDDKTIRIWGTESGKELIKLDGHKDRIENIIVTPDEKKMISRCGNGSVRIWNLSGTENLLATLEKKQIAEEKLKIETKKIAEENEKKQSAREAKEELIAERIRRTKEKRLSDFIAQAPVIEIKGHEDAIKALAVSPDGKIIVTGSKNDIRIWNAVSGQEIKRIDLSKMGKKRGSQGSENWVYSVAFSSDGKKIVTGSNDMIARIWNAETFEVIQTFEGHLDAVISAVFSPDSKKIVSIAEGKDYAARIWDVETGKEIRELEWERLEYERGGEKFITSHTHGSRAFNYAIFSPDGKKIVTTLNTSAGLALVWDADSGKISHKLAIPYREVNVTQYIPSLSYSMAEVIDVGTTYGITFTPDGKKTIITADGALLTWDIYSGVLIDHFAVNSSIRIRDFSTRGFAMSTTRNASNPILFVNYSPDGKQWVTRHQDKPEDLLIVDSTTSNILQKLEGHDGEIIAAVFSPDGSRVITASADKTVRIWNLKAAVVGKKLNVITPTFSFNSNHGTDASSLSADGKTLIIVNNVFDNRYSNIFTTHDIAQIIDVDSGKTLHRLVQSRNIVGDAISPDGKYVVTTDLFRAGAFTWKGEIWIWDVRTGKTLQKIEGMAADALFLPDGKQIVSANPEFVQIWDAETGKMLRQFDQRTGNRNSVNISPDGKKLLTAHGDGIVRLWDIEDSESPLRKLRGHEGSIISAFFSSDGKKFLREAWMVQFGLGTLILVKH